MNSSKNPVHPGSGSNPAEVGHRHLGDQHAVTLVLGDEPGRNGWYGTPEQAEALAAALTEQANAVRNTEGGPR